MKLQAGNPNLMRVNKPVGLGTFANTLGDVAAKKRHRPSSVYVPAKRDPDLVPAPALSIWERDSYVPQNLTPMRSGANDFLRCKSKGF